MEPVLATTPLVVWCGFGTHPLYYTSGCCVAAYAAKMRAMGTRTLLVRRVSQPQWGQHQAQWGRLLKGCSVVEVLLALSADEPVPQHSGGWWCLLAVDSLRGMCDTGYSGHSQGLHARQM
jgi:hypothetical protein